MALGITELINNISDSIDALQQDLTGAAGDPNIPYPQSVDLQTIQSQINQENWSKLSFPYTFSVINYKNPSNNASGFSDFSLPIAPQAINQSEEPAIVIKPTQGGTTVNHSGNKYKLLTISGTTGISPYRGTGGVDRRTGEAIFQPKEIRYKSGYEVFLLLRNWFRSYYEFKKTGGRDAQPYRLLFKNYKDGEFLVVELQKFEMDRQSSRPLLYDYKLEFKVLAHFDFLQAAEESQFGALQQFEQSIQRGLDQINFARGVFLRSQGILRQVESTYESVVIEPLRQITLAAKALLNLPLVAADIGNRAIRNTLTQADSLALALDIRDQQKQNAVSGGLSPAIANIELPEDLQSAVQNRGSEVVTEFGEGLLEIDSGKFPESTLAQAANDQEAAAALPRSFFEETTRSLRRVKENAEDFLNLGDSQYDALFDRESTLSAPFTKVVTLEEYELLEGFNQAVSGIYQMLASTDLFKSTFDEKVADIVERFQGRIELVANPAVRQIRYQQGDTLERIAQRELGDSNRWGEIVEVNNLKAPYTSDDPLDSRDSIVKPGDKLLIPTPLRNGFSSVPIVKENKLTENLTQLEKSLGVDFRLNKDFDISLTSTDDLQLVAGTDNMAQATMLKLSYEPGEVIRHPQLGSGVLPGQKFPDINDIKDGVTNSLLQDSRVSRIEDLSIIRENSSLTLSFNLFVKQVDIPIPVKIQI